VDDNLKTKVIFALGALSVILLVTTLNSCNHVGNQEKKWRKEMALRLDSEEKAQKSGQEQVALSGELKKTQELLQENTKALESAKNTLLQEQMVNKNLQEELDKVSKLKAALEEDLKKALINGGKKPVVQVQK
jgi:hypothetical protein